ncbi:MAG: family N-acetyltransferase [Myxococcales bacterium]|nr:family N-acetyltransferase [Myxococcales bacterium]
MLAGGGEAQLRLLDADDKGLLRRGFERLSDDGRYNRFFVRKRMLLDAELDYLTELDQIHHLALVAVRATALEPTEGLAVARAVRLVTEPHVYEGAIAVVDEFQGRGLGAALLRRLMAATAERGGGSLRFCLLPTNTAMRALLTSLAPQSAFVDEDGVLRLDIPLDGSSPARSTAAALDARAGDRLRPRARRPPAPGR